MESRCIDRLQCHLLSAVSTGGVMDPDKESFSIILISISICICLYNIYLYIYNICVYACVYIRTSLGNTEDNNDVKCTSTLYNHFSRECAYSYFRRIFLKLLSVLRIIRCICIYHITHCSYIFLLSHIWLCRCLNHCILR